MNRTGPAERVKMAGPCEPETPVPNRSPAAAAAGVFAPSPPPAGPAAAARVRRSAPIGYSSRSELGDGDTAAELGDGGGGTGRRTRRPARGDSRHPPE